MIWWGWGLLTSLTVTAVILMNGKGWRSGWAVGVLAQVMYATFGVVNGLWTFLFSLIPAVGFGYNWYMHPRRNSDPPAV